MVGQNFAKQVEARRCDGIFIRLSDVAEDGDDKGPPAADTDKAADRERQASVSGRRVGRKPHDRLCPLIEITRPIERCASVGGGAAGAVGGSVCMARIPPAQIW
jgi:hypothetical protein